MEDRPGKRGFDDDSYASCCIDFCIGIYHDIYDEEDTAGKMEIEAALFWVIMALMLVVFAVFPSVADFCARLLGIYATTNFLFLFMIFLLIVKLFSMTVHISQLESRQRELIQKMALEKRFKEEEEEMKDGDERRTAGTVSEQVQ